MLCKDNIIIIWFRPLPIFKDTILTILDLRLHRMPCRTNDKQILVLRKATRNPHPTNRLLDTLFRSELTACRGNRIERQKVNLHKRVVKLIFLQ